MPPLPAGIICMKGQKGPGRRTVQPQAQVRGEWIMTTVAMIITALLAVFALKTYWWQMKIKWNGTETDAVVSLIEEETLRPISGNDFTRYRCHSYYASFLKEDGLETDAKLINPVRNLTVGSRIRIRYLPGRDNLAVLTKITEE